MTTPRYTGDYLLALVRVKEISPVTYSLETAAQLAGIHPDRLRYYCLLGLLGETRARTGTELLFDDDAIFELRRFEHFRQHHGVNRKTLRLLCRLWREVETLRAELRFLRGP